MSIPSVVNASVQTERKVTELSIRDDLCNLSTLSSYVEKFSSFIVNMYIYTPRTRVTLPPSPELSSTRRDTFTKILFKIISTLSYIPLYHF